MSRLDNAYIIPTSVVIGINIQKAIGVLQQFYTYRTQSKSPYYYLNVVASILNLMSIFVGAALIDFTNSPFQTSTGFGFYLLHGIACLNLITASILLYLLFLRMYKFHGRNSLITKYFAPAVAIAFLARCVSFYYNSVVTLELARNPTAINMSDHPLFPHVALWITLTNSTDSLCFIPATMIFLYQIANELKVKGWNLFKLLFLENSGIDYILLIGVKLYIVVAALVAVFSRAQDNSTFPVQYVIGWSHTLSIHMFLSSSFKTCKDILKFRLDAMQDDILPGNSIVPPPQEEKSAKSTL